MFTQALAHLTRPFSHFRHWRRHIIVSYRHIVSCKYSRLWLCIHQARLNKHALDMLEHVLVTYKHLQYLSCVVYEYWERLIIMSKFLKPTFSKQGWICGGDCELYHLYTDLRITLMCACSFWSSVKAWKGAQMTFNICTVEGSTIKHMEMVVKFVCVGNAVRYWMKTLKLLPLQWWLEHKEIENFVIKSA